MKSLGVDRNTPFPLYKQIKDFILHMIRITWPPNSRVPSEHELVREWGVSRMTVNRAIRELVSEGYLTRIQGVGTFVAARRASFALIEIKSIAKEIQERNGLHSSKVLLLRREPASQDLAFSMNLKPGEPVFHSIVLHMEDGAPVQYEDKFVNPTLAPHYLEQDFEAITPSQYLLEVVPLTEAEHIIEAVMPDSEIRKLLKLKSKEPCLVLHRRTWAGKVIATRTRFVYPGRYQIFGRFKPPQGSKMEE